MTAVADPADPVDAAPRPTRRPRWLRWATNLELLALVGLAVAWELTARLFDVSFLPPVGDIAGRVVELVGQADLRADVTRSIRNLVTGFGVSVAIGVPLGLAMARFKAVRYGLEPYVNAALIAPSLVFAPIFFVIFGLSPSAVIAVVVMYSVFIIILSTERAVSEVRKPLQNMARVFGASEMQVQTRIVIPSASPMILAGIRIGLARAVKGMVNGEMFIAAVGLGRRSMQYGAVFDATGVFAILVIVIAIALVATSALQALERRLTGWTALRR